MLCTFGVCVAANPGSDLLIAGAEGQVFAVGDHLFATPLPIWDLEGIPLASLISSAQGLIDEFQADIPDDGGQVVWRSGDFPPVLLSSYAYVRATALEAAAAAETVRADMDSLQEGLGSAPAVLPAGGTPDVDVLWRGPAERTGVWAPPPTGTGGSGIAGAPAAWPGEFPPSAHQHTSGQINDSTTVGRAVMTAATQAAARAAIGAGTGNGSSNLQVGPSGSDAAAGNHSHSASAISFAPGSGITATNLQAAVEQTATMGGSAGPSPILIWRYTSGAWPALPATKPAGVLEVAARGPSYPTTLPSWVGLASDKVPLSYSKVAVA